jgi:hypothetical protein
MSMPSVNSMPIPQTERPVAMSSPTWSPPFGRGSPLVIDRRSSGSSVIGRRKADGGDRQVRLQASDKRVKVDEVEQRCCRARYYCQR